MTWKLIATFLLSLLQLEGCGKPICSMLGEATSPRREVRLLSRGPIHDARLVGSDLIIVSGGTDDRKITRAREGALEETLADVEVQTFYGEGLVVVDHSRWWYGIAGGHGRRFGTSFVVGDTSSAATKTFVPHRFSGPFQWLPLEGSEPRGLFVFFRSETELEALEIGLDGPGRTWILEAPRQYGFRGGWSAERLADGRIVLISIDERMVARILGDAGAVQTIDLRNDERVLQIATASDDRGRVAVVVAVFRAPSIRATVFDPDRPSDQPWEILSDGVHAGLPAVIATSDGFVAAWVQRGDSPTVQVRSLDRAGLTLNLGPTVWTPDEHRGVFLSRAGSEELIAVWQGRQTMMRRFPNAVSGFAFLIDAAAAVCGRLTQEDRAFAQDCVATQFALPDIPACGHNAANFHGEVRGSKRSYERIARESQR